MNPNPRESLWITTIILCLRIILKLKNGKGDLEYFQLPNGGQKRFYSDLMSHVKIDPQKRFALHEIYRSFVEWLGEDIVPTFSEFVEMHSKCNTNMHGILIYSEECVHYGNALYLGASAIDHSCQPNSLWINDGKELVLRTISDVADFSDLRVPYIDTMTLCSVTLQRKIELFEVKFS